MQGADNAVFRQIEFPSGVDHLKAFVMECRFRIQLFRILSGKKELEGDRLHHIPDGMKGIFCAGQLQQMSAIAFSSAHQLGGDVLRKATDGVLPAKLK